MNINVKWRDRKSAVLTLELETGLPVDLPVLILKWETPDPMYAELLTRHVRDEIENTMQRIRKANYDKGWSDAKSKRNKRDRESFSCRMMKEENEE